MMRIRSNLSLTCIVCATSVLTSSNAATFKIGSAFTDPCHEQITLRGFFQDDSLEGEQILVPSNIFEGKAANQSATWLQIAQYLESEVDYKFRSDFERFLGITLFIGTRYPDQANFAIMDINNLRDLHLAVEGQEGHALRAIDYDFEFGNEQAVVSLRDYIRELVDEAYESFEGSRPESGAAINKTSLKNQTVKVGFWLDFYGTIDVEVWRPLFLLGQAAHALQDSFAHTYRSEDTQSIYAVGNFVEAISTDYAESRDGPRHSDQIDDCQDPRIKPLVDAAINATRALFFAFRDYLAASNADEATRLAASANLDRVIAEQTAYQSGCGFENNYCETPWAVLAKEAETAPLLGCTNASPAPWFMTLAGLLSLHWYRRRERSTQQQNDV